MAVWCWLGECWYEGAFREALCACLCYGRMVIVAFCWGHVCSVGWLVAVIARFVYLLSIQCRKFQSTADIVGTFIIAYVFVA